MSAFRTVILDVDSTLCGVEGIDWLAQRRGKSVVTEVTQLTRSAMDGEVPLDVVYGRRLALVAPNREDVTALGREYLRTVAPGAFEAISAMMKSDVKVLLISGGLRPAVDAVGRAAGVEERNVHAVGIYFADDGTYASYESGSPMTRQSGKKDILASLSLEAPVMMVGDGMTDADVRPVVDAFAAFTGFARREPVIAKADYVVSSFDELLTLVNG